MARAVFGVSLILGAAWDVSESASSAFVSCYTLIFLVSYLGIVGLFFMWTAWSVSESSLDAYALRGSATHIAWMRSSRIFKLALGSNNQVRGWFLMDSVFIWLDLA